MLVLVLVLAVVGLIISAHFMVKIPRVRYNSDFGVHELFVFLSWLFGITIAVIIIAICCLITKVATQTILDEKISMYQEENTIIEQDIDRIVEEYLKYEKDTFSDLKTDESSITLVTLFPELKSDSLVQQQLEIYVSNNEKIKELKEEKIDITKIEWILYFG